MKGGPPLHGHELAVPSLSHTKPLSDLCAPTQCPASAAPEQPTAGPSVAWPQGWGCMPGPGVGQGTPLTKAFYRLLGLSLSKKLLELTLEQRQQFLPQFLALRESDRGASRDTGGCRGAHFWLSRPWASSHAGMGCTTGPRQVLTGQALQHAFLTVGWWPRRDTQKGTWQNTPLSIVTCR